MDTVQKDDQGTQIVYTLTRASHTVIATVQKTDDGSLKYTVDVVRQASDSPPTWQDYVTELEAGVTIEEI